MRYIVARCSPTTTPACENDHEVVVVEPHIVQRGFYSCQVMLTQ